MSVMVWNKSVGSSSQQLHLPGSLFIIFALNKVNEVAAWSTGRSVLVLMHWSSRFPPVVAIPDVSGIPQSLGIQDVIAAIGGW